MPLISNTLWRTRLFFRRRRKLFQRGTPVAFFGLILVFLRPLVADLVANRPDGEATVAFDNGTLSPYCGQLTLAKLKIDLIEMTVKGDLDLSIAANSNVSDIDVVIFGYIPSADALVYTIADPKTAGSSGSIAPGQTGDHFPTAGIHANIEVPLHIIRKSAWYPFDRYDFSVAPQGCIGTSGCEKSFLVTEKMAAKLAEQQFVIEQRVESDVQHPGAVRVTYTVARPFFVRWVSIWVSGFLGVIMLYLVWFSDPRDLIIKAAGYFGTMWAFRQLIIPPFFPVFPTAIDYCVLTLFSMLFFVVSYRVIKEKLEV